MSNINPNAKIYAILADSVYWDIRYGQRKDGSLDQQNSNWTPIPNGWSLIKEESHSGKDFPNFDGFTARAYKNSATNEIVVAFAGTEFSNILGDWTSNNLPLFLSTFSGHANKAAIFYHELKHDNPDARITFTGHSLGGGLAGLMGILFDREAYLFDHAPFENQNSNFS